MAEIAVSLDLNADLLSLLVPAVAETEGEGAQDFSQFVLSQEDYTAVPMELSQKLSLVKFEQETAELPEVEAPITSELKVVELLKPSFTEQGRVPEGFIQLEEVATSQLESYTNEKELRQDVAYLEAAKPIILEFLKAEFPGEDLSLLKTDYNASKVLLEAQKPVEEVVPKLDNFRINIDYGNQAQVKVLHDETALPVEDIQLVTPKTKEGQPQIHMIDQVLSQQTEDEQSVGFLAKDSLIKSSSTQQDNVLPFKEVLKGNESKSITEDIKTEDVVSIKASEQDVAKAKIEVASTVHKPTVYNPERITQQLVHHVKEAFVVGADKVTVQLNPPSLGKVEIELRFSEDGRVAAVFNMDKSDTFDLLQRNPHLLKQTLEESGFDASTSDFTFNLNGQDEETDKQPMNKGSANQIDSTDLVHEKQLYISNDHYDPSREVDIHA